MTQYIQPWNYAYGTLNAPITSGASSLTFTTSTGTTFPVLSATAAHAQQYFYLTLVDALTQGVTTREIVKVVGPSAATSGVITYTILRAQEGTTAHAFAAGDGVQMRWTAQMAADLGYQTSCPDGWFNVKDFGAVGDGASTTGSANTSDATAIRAALTAAKAYGAGTVYIPPGRYLMGTADILDVSASNITFQGATAGSNMPLNFNPATHALSSVILITNTTITGGQNSNGFIDSPSGQSSADNLVVQDLMFFWPNQVTNHNGGAELSPTVYPYAVRLTALGGAVRRCMFCNAYNGVAIDTTSNTSGIGRQYITDCYFGGYGTGIFVDKAGDPVFINGCIVGGAWDGATYATDGGLWKWTYDNGVGIDLYDARGIHITDTVVYGKYISIRMQNNNQGNSGYGFIKGVDLGPSQYCIYNKSTQDSRTYQISNAILANGSQTPNHNAIYLAAGGTSSPTLSVYNSEIRDIWTDGNTTVAAGNLFMSDVIGVTDVGGLTPGAIGASPYEYTNNLGNKLNIYITGGTVSKIEIKAAPRPINPTPAYVDTGVTSGLFVLQPYQKIKITYTVIPTWTWFAA